MSSSGIEKALDLLKKLPRVSLGNLRPLPGTRKKKVLNRGHHSGFTYTRGRGGQKRVAKLPPIGFEGGQFPFYLRIPKEPYYRGEHVRLQYPPLSLLQLQRMIDLGWLDIKQPIDLTSLCNTKVFHLDVTRNQCGVHLTDDGVDVFKAQVNIEVQWASELVIAAVERNGGTITTRYFDKLCVEAMKDPQLFFTKGLPIPRCKLPPENLVEYYSSAANRGYLANPEEIFKLRLQLAQKYGYSLVDVTDAKQKEMLLRRKDARQIWYGLEPGWLVNLAQKCILKPTDEALNTFYRS